MPPLSAVILFEIDRTKWPGAFLATESGIIETTATVLDYLLARMRTSSRESTELSYA